MGRIEGFREEEEEEVINIIRYYCVHAQEQEAVIVGDMSRLQSVMKDLKECSSSPSILPEHARDMVEVSYCTTMCYQIS